MCELEPGQQQYDDDQGGDMPRWMFRQKSYREENRKTALKREDSKNNPAQPKKIITLLDMMSRSKGVPLERSVLLDQL